MLASALSMHPACRVNENSTARQYFDKPIVFSEEPRRIDAPCLDWVRTSMSTYHAMNRWSQSLREGGLKPWEDAVFQRILGYFAKVEGHEKPMGSVLVVLLMIIF